MSDYDEFAKRMGSFDMELSLNDINPDTDNDSLAHYGIKGMKWGVRRYQKITTGQNGTRKTTPESKNKKNIKAQKKAAGMTDQELRERINRIQMEKQYSQITAKEKNKGAKFVTTVLMSVATAKATSYVSKNVDTIIPKLVSGAKNAVVTGTLLNDIRKYK